MYIRGHQHRKSWDVSWGAHFLTFSCFQRQPFLRSDRACRWFLENLTAAKTWAPFDLWGYVLMPEHVHVLLLPGEGVRISRILYQLKQPVTLRVIAWLREHSPDFLGRMEDRQPNGKVTHRFWQRGGGYDRNLRSVADVHEKLVYLQNNPVRRGLVERAEDHVWSSARAWMTGEDKPIPIDRESLPPLMA